MSQVSFRIDEKLKNDGERLFKSMGMNMSVAITVFIQQSLQRGKLPFEVVGDPFYSDSNMRELERRARERWTPAETSQSMNCLTPRSRSMRKIWHESAWDEYVAWQREDAKTLKRINQADRIVFRISALTPDENALEILQCKGHYG